MIEGVVITPLEQIRDERGAVYHMLRADAPHFAGFGEIYFSVVNSGVIKSWRRHFRMTMSLAVPKGRVKFVLADDAGRIEEVVLGDSGDDYRLLSVPPMVWCAFQGLGDEPAIVANCASVPHSSNEAEKMSLDNDQIEYTW